MCGRAAAAWEAVAALDPGPKAAVGEAVMGLITLEWLVEFALSDMRDEAEVGAGSAQLLVHVEGGEVAIIPGATEEGRQVTAAAFEGLDDGGELLLDGEERAVSGRL